MSQQLVNNDEIDLREYLEVVLKRWPIIALFAAGVAAVALVFSLLQKPVYEADATILIKSSGSGSSVSQFAGLASLAGINLGTGGGDISDLIEVLQSNAVAAKVVENLKLRERIKGWNDPGISERQLASAVQGMLAKPKPRGNLVVLTAENNDPELAADIANGFADALSYYWNKLNSTEARRKREYVEGQLPRIEKELRIAETRLKQYTLLGAAPESQGIEVARLYRELEIQSSVYNMLRKEYETVKLEESKDIEPFTIIDRAVKPGDPSRPKTKMNVMLGLFLGLLSGVFMAFFLEYWKKTAKMPE